ncbi:hypothetical protein LIER_25615 [Lithospermum erythrorhizon]|uniref:Protein YIP n=1 Tax=Lithospermum erythrorhizon TaxID=34254 RepID=A0AAV3R5H9_LITER
MDDSISNLPTSHLLGSVPAVVSEKRSSSNNEAPKANLQIFPPNNNGSGDPRYETYTTPNEGDVGQSSSGWSGVFSISSYTQYFNVDTDVIMNRMTSSLFPHVGDFFQKIEANPDLYGLIWISTTLVFVIASLGNCATYLIQRKGDGSTTWAFDVNYINVAASSIYGYAVIVPLGFYFLLQYLGSKASLVHFWCLWGYSLFIFILTSFLLVIPVEFLRWTFTLVSGATSASFVTLNLKTYIEANDLTMVPASAFILQMGLAIFIKMWFFS